MKKPIRGKRSASDSSDKKTKSVPPSIPLFSHWLMKSEPETRLEYGVDVKVQDLLLRDLTTSVIGLVLLYVFLISFQCSSGLRI